MFEAEDLDLVYITTPVSSHFPITSLCIKNKINFFVEKPLTGSLEESERLCTSLKQEHQIIHSVGYNRRFIPTFSRAKALLDTQILGDPSYVKSSMYVSNILSKPTGWRSKKNVSGGGESCQECLLDYRGDIIAMSILAGGYLRLDEAYEYILSQPKIKNVVIGISSVVHAQNTLQLLLNKENEKRYKFD